MYSEYTDGMDRVMRYESIAEDLSSAFATAGMPNGAIPVINRTGRADGSGLPIVLFSTVGVYGRDRLR